MTRSAPTESLLISVVRHIFRLPGIKQDANVSSGEFVTFHKHFAGGLTTTYLDANSVESYTPTSLTVLVRPLLQIA